MRPVAVAVGEPIQTATAMIVHAYQNIVSTQRTNQVPLLLYHVAAMNEAVTLSSEDLLNLYYYMRLNRALEDRLIALYRQATITATVFSSRGQEATSVGSAYALDPGDYVSPITRNLGTMLVRGIPPRD